MGEFYGLNLFLAESSATTGGLDSLLEPTGNIKRSQDMAARAFGADHVFFVTNGTSTSNKMACRRCGARRHRGGRPQLPQVAPLRHGADRRPAAYVEAFPMTEYSMYGAVPLRTIKRALLALEGRGPLDRLKLLDLTNCTFDGHMYNVGG
jgi:arginine decarboxylase